MKLLVLACFIGLVAAKAPLVAEAPLELAQPFAEPSDEDVAKAPIVDDYHMDIGIPELARIKAAEEATDFSGVRIVGGSTAGQGQYPHLGGLIIPLTTGQQSVCGSSLISNNRILTAARCWRSTGMQARSFQVVFGSVRLFSGGTRVNTNNVVVHPNYNTNTLANDVAVGVIIWINFNNVIQPIPHASGNNNFVGTWATAARFGAQRDGAGISQSQTIHHVNLQVITNNVCANTFGSTIISSTLCVATNGGRSTCGGDSGGPLEANVNGRRTLIGVTSFGHVRGCQRNYPAGFARVTSFNSWICSHM